MFVRPDRDCNEKDNEEQHKYHNKTSPTNGVFVCLLSLPYHPEGVERNDLASTLIYTITVN